MPQRTNAFQEVVTLLQRLFAPAGATVTPSAMVEPTPGADKREVDVLVEYEETAHTVRVAVEAKDFKRAADVGTVEQYIGKYNTPGGIAVDKVIIVAKSFTKNARKRAAHVGFELHTLKTLNDVKVGRFSPEPNPEGKVGWVLANRLGNIVEVSLISDTGIVLPNNYLNGRLKCTNDATHSLASFRTPTALAKALIAEVLGTQADAVFGHLEGASVGLCFELLFGSCTVSVMNLPRVKVSKMVFDFGEMLKLPDFKTEAFALNKGGEERKVVMQTAKGERSSVTFTYDEQQESVLVDHAPGSLPSFRLSAEFSDTTLFSGMEEVRRKLNGMWEATKKDRKFSLEESIRLNSPPPAS